MGSEKFSNSTESGYNKGTIRSDIRYLVVSKDVRRHRLTVTAEVASSSLVVPAIPNQALTPVEEFSRGHKRVQIPREASNSAHSSESKRPGRQDISEPNATEQLSADPV
jgi:hypothetical protein